MSGQQHARHIPVMCAEVVEALQPLRTPNIRISDSEVRSLLAVLDEHGGMAVSLVRLSEMSGLPSARIGRYVSQLQQLVNIDPTFSQKLFFGIPRQGFEFFAVIRDTIGPVILAK